MITQDFTKQTKELIDNLKGVCASYGLGNDGNEFKIITQAFLYKFMNDKFVHEIKKLDAKLNGAANWEQVISKYSDSEYEIIIYLTYIIIKIGKNLLNFLMIHYVILLFLIKTYFPLKLQQMQKSPYLMS